MRIATSTLYSQQIASIDDLTQQYSVTGQQLSSGKRLTQPSDDPTHIASDLTLNQTITQEDTDTTDATSAKNQLTLVDSTLSTLTDILSTARSLAVASATDVIPNGTQRKSQAKQVDGLLNQAIGLANAQYGTTYIFAGTGPRSTPPVVAQGSPANNVLFSGNNDKQTQLINGQTFTTSSTLQETFNYNSTDGSPSVFTLLATLRDTMNTEPVVDQSGASVNKLGTAILTQPTSPVATTLGGASFAVPLQADNAVPPSYSIEIDGVAPGTTQPPTQSTLTFTNATAVDDGTATSVVGQINAQTAVTGVTARFDVPSQRLVLSAPTPFRITDVPTPAPPAATAGTTAANFTKVFGLQNQADVINNLSTQIGDVDKVLNTLLQARATIGERIQGLSSATTQLASISTDNTAVKSGYEDTNVAAATVKFTQQQTALQAAYATTTRLEGKSLMDYLPASIG